MTERDDDRVSDGGAPRRRPSPEREVPGWRTTVRWFRITALIVAAVTILLVYLLWPR